ncbi:MAG: bifunctional riboflavin kinase/FAD synthetase [Deltaproteobacteria bacterium]|nr:bifunctional riboflavin kinase/FAD synthetase [Deltaproteobacteria bacterium]
MEIIKGIENLKEPFRNPVVTLGNFDGVHLGHQRIFKKVKEEARKIGGESVVITFEPHPLKILSPDQCPPLLTPFKKKMMFIEETGVDKVLCIQFTMAFAWLSPPEFVKSILAGKVGAKKILVGYNYRFGKEKSGDVDSLKENCARFGIEVEVVEALIVDDAIVSSSKIRDLIGNGEVEKASKLMGRDYPVIGRVIEGAKRGHTLGIPTANLEMTEELYPKPGVYAVRVNLHGQGFNGLANIGFNPTFNANAVSLEVHILNFDREIYGEDLQVCFTKRIRDEIRFTSIEMLIEQIRKDIEWAKTNVFRNQ